MKGTSPAAELDTDGAGVVSSHQEVGAIGSSPGPQDRLLPAPTPHPRHRHLLDLATFPESAENTWRPGIMERSDSNLLNSNFEAFSAHTAFIKLVFSSGTQMAY
jgi:hypothetical protein